MPAPGVGIGGVFETWFLVYRHFDGIFVGIGVFWVLVIILSLDRDMGPNILSASVSVYYGKPTVDNELNFGYSKKAW